MDMDLGDCMAVDGEATAAAGADMADTVMAIHGAVMGDGIAPYLVVAGHITDFMGSRELFVINCEPLLSNFDELKRLRIVFAIESISVFCVALRSAGNSVLDRSITLVHASDSSKIIHCQKFVWRS